MASWSVSTIKNPPEMQEMQVQSLGREDPLEEEMATHSNILAREDPTNRDAWQAIGLQRVGQDKSN